MLLPSDVHNDNDATTDNNDDDADDDEQDAEGVSWGFSSALYIPHNEQGNRVHRPGELKSLDPRLIYMIRDLNLLFGTNHEIYNNEARIQQLKSHNAILQETNDFLKRIVDRTTKNLVLSKETEIDELIKLRTEKLQTQIASGTAAIEDLKRQVEKLVSKTDANTLQEDKVVLKDMTDVSGWSLMNDGSVFVFQKDAEGVNKVAFVLEGADILQSQVDKQFYQYEKAEKSESESESENENEITDENESELAKLFIQTMEVMDKDKDQNKDEDETEFARHLRDLEDLAESEENEGAVESQKTEDALEGRNEDSFEKYDDYNDW
ncbi:hypothetical protein ACLKA6_006251 [Drosophila palustris]